MLINVGVYEPEPFEAEPAVAERVQAIMTQARAAVAADKRLADVRAGTVPKLRAAAPAAFRTARERHVQLTPHEEAEARGELVRGVRAIQADADAALDAALAEYHGLRDDPPDRRPTAEDYQFLRDHLEPFRLAGFHGEYQRLARRQLIEIPLRTGRFGRAALVLPVLRGLHATRGSGWDGHDALAFIHLAEVATRGLDRYRGEYGQREVNNVRFKLTALCQASIDHAGDFERSLFVRNGYFTDWGIEGAAAKQAREAAEAVAIDARLRAEALAKAASGGGNADVVMNF